MRFVGCCEDDMKILITKQFVIPFESGICVIKHWKIHNYIQKDRYEQTIYTEEKSQLEVVEKQYVVGMDTKCIQNGDTGKVRLELEKELEIEINTPKSPKGKTVSFDEFNYNPELLGVLKDYEEHIKALGKGYKKTDRAWELFKGKVEKIARAHGDEVAIQQVNAAIEGNWKTIYEPKTKTAINNSNSIESIRWDY